MGTVVTVPIQLGQATEEVSVSTGTSALLRFTHLAFSCILVHIYEDPALCCIKSMYDALSILVNGDGLS